MDYQEKIIAHYKKQFEVDPNIYYHDKGPINKLPYDFRVLEFSPNSARDYWVYTTCCMSQFEDEIRVELHLLSPKQDESIIEILTATSYYHRTTNKLDLNHTLNFGKPWQDNSICTYGFISLPYLYGPTFENLILSNKSEIIKNYWLIPITLNEVEYKKKYGAEELENLFDINQFNYMNPKRNSLVE